ncbi:unnamed protein product [Linum tenue]|uniref:Sulfotransferase n=1 Tax=Linum tenue TaxID=586396 RepID=A0AAV0GZY1_9ROSI|nr:unnamed protein product [Linum tenue]
MNNNMPKVLFWNSLEICQIDGFWYFVVGTERIAAFRSGFRPRSDDIFLTSFIKTGTTWLKALCYNILKFDDDEEEDRLAKMNPHEVVPSLEINFVEDGVQRMLLSCSPPRLLHTHVPYCYLPEAVRESGCRFVYVARNPKDTVVSMWHFYNKMFTRDGGSEPFPLEGAVESFCSGAVPYGPFYEHVLGYWEESQRRPEEVLFLKYEELCREPKEQVRKLASFMGRPFPSTLTTRDGDDDEGVEKVLWRSSLGRLKELEVNKNGVLVGQLSNAHFFRKGTVGDWKNYLTPQMAERIDQLTQFKLQGTELPLDD